MRIVQKLCIFTASSLIVGICAFAGAGFMLREKDGVLAVWDCAAEGWHYISDTPVASLPAADRNAIRQGMSLATEQELSAALEDYCG